MQNFPWILGCSYKKWGFSYQEWWFSRKKNVSQSQRLWCSDLKTCDVPHFFIWRGRSFSGLVESVPASLRNSRCSPFLGIALNCLTQFGVIYFDHLTHSHVMCGVLLRVSPHSAPTLFTLSSSWVCCLKKIVVVYIQRGHKFAILWPSPFNFRAQIWIQHPTSILGSRSVASILLRHIQPIKSVDHVEHTHCWWALWWDILYVKGSNLGTHKMEICKNNPFLLILNVPPHPSPPNNKHGR